MRSILFLLLLVLAFGCRKADHGLGEIYESLIGTWEKQVGDDKAKIIVKPSGHMIFSQSVNRAGNFKVVSLNYDQSLSSQKWSTYNVVTKKNRTPYLRIKINDNKDSLWCNFASSIIDHTTTYNRYVFVKTK
jgi:hypothetical protein